jgi:hypothetical protein
VSYYNYTVTYGEAGVTTERYFPCRCGETHRGDYAFEEWNHHNCFHRSELVDIGRPYLPVRSYLLCMDCGEVFHVEVKDP